MPCRWAVRKLDVDLLMAATESAAWSGILTRPLADVDEEAARLQGVLMDICDAAMPRIRRAPPVRRGCTGGRPRSHN